MKKLAITVGATEFKADRKRNSIIITKRGKPYAKVVPVESVPGAFRGCTKGSVTILGDLTEPLDIEWEALKD